MADPSRIILIDEDEQRASQISKALRREFEVLRFSNLRDLCGDVQPGSVVLRAGDSRSISQVLERLRELRVWVPVIGYGPAPIPIQAAVAAMSAGAADFLEWPSNAAVFAASIRAVRGAALAQQRGR